MSKERARRREVREREAAIRAAARAAQQERRERRAARRRAVRTSLLRTSDRFGVTSTGRQTGVLARRERRQNTWLVAVVVLVNVVVWVLRPDWAARLAAVVVSVLLLPVLRLLRFSRP